MDGREAADITALDLNKCLGATSDDRLIKMLDQTLWNLIYAKLIPHSPLPPSKKKLVPFWY